VYNNLKLEGRAGTGIDLCKVVTGREMSTKQNKTKQNKTKTREKRASAVPSVKYENVADFLMLH